MAAPGAYENVICPHAFSCFFPLLHKSLQRHNILVGTSFLAPADQSILCLLTGSFMRKLR